MARAFKENPVFWPGASANQFGRNKKKKKEMPMLQSPEKAGG